MRKLISKLYFSPALEGLFHTLVCCLKKELKDCESVLDLGCGPSSPLQYCQNIKYSVGVEPFKPYLNVSKKKKIHTKYLNKKIDELDFPEKSFDAVIVIEVLEHLTKSEGEILIKNVERWAKKKVIITTPNGFISQKEVDNNPLQKHLSGWDYKTMKELGYRINGLAGLKFLRQEVQSDTMGEDLMTSIRFKPRLFWFIVATLSQAIIFYLPKFTFELFSIKNMIRDRNYYDRISRYDKKIFDFQDEIGEIIYSPKILKELIKKVDSSNSSLKIVDLGCGNAYLLRFLRDNCQKSHQYYGVDASGAIIEANSVRYPIINFFKEDVLKTKFKNNFFDIVISTMVIEHLDDDLKFIKEVKRILKKGSFFLISSVMKKKGAWYYLKNSQGESVLTLDHVREYSSEEELEKLFSKCNFQILSLQSTPMYFPLVDGILRRLINFIPEFLIKSKVFDRIIQVFRKFKIPIRGYYAIEAFCLSK